MEETRKYFDYELAYEGYMRAKELLENGGIQALEEEFEEVGDRANGYTTFYGADYNTWVYVSNINFDTDLQEEWQITGEVDIISYSGGDDTLFINDLSSIEERIDKLLDYAKLNEYTIEDYEKELRGEINCFFASNKIPLKTVLKYRAIFAKQTIRKFIGK